MARIRVKDKKPNEPRRRDLLWQSIGLAHATTYKVDDAKDAYYLVTSDENVEKLLSIESKDIFKQNGFEIQNPPEYNALRTITAKYVDRQVLEYREDDIKKNIEKENEWAKVEEVIKIPNNPHILKVRFETTQMARKAIDGGILILHQSIPSKDVEKEIFINLTPCYRCYSYEHRLKDCDKDETYKACSECASKEHTYRDCQATTKKCLSCHQDHRTLAAKCQVRKDIIKKRIKEERTKNIGQRSSQNIQQKTYAGALTNNSPNNPLDLFSTLPKNAPSVILSAIAYGYYREAQEKGSFQKSVDEMYILNNIPTVKFPTDINPDKIVPTLNSGVDTNAVKWNNLEEENIAQEITRIRNIDNNAFPRGNVEIENGNTEEDNDNSEEEEEEENEKIQHDELSEENQQISRAQNKGLKLLIPEIKLRAKEKSKEIIPKRPTHSDIVKLIKNKTIKYSYFHPNIQDDEVVRDMINNKEIDLSAFRVLFIKDNTYNKLSNGTREIPHMLTRKYTEDSKDSWY